MARIYDSLTALVGHTPLVRLHGYEKLHSLDAHILAKVEYFNPIGSIKDRIILKIIEDAEQAGKLQPGTTLVETSSGNTGIALAAIGAMKGYKVRVYLQDGVSEERRKIMSAFGAEVLNVSKVPLVKEVLDATDNDFVAGYAKLKETLRNEKGIFFVDQMLNPMNPHAHYDSTGREIWEDTDGSLAAVVAGVGTAGTIRGISDYIKSQSPQVRIVAVEPEPEDKTLTGIHNFTEVPDERVPVNIQKKIYDEVLVAKADGALKAVREVAKTDGMLIGASGGAALWGATQIAARAEFAGKNIVVVFPDTGLRYLSQGIFSDDK